MSSNQKQSVSSRIIFSYLLDHKIKIFLALIIYPFVKLNSYRLSYLVGLQNFLPISGFLLLNFAGDLFQNQSIAWIFWLYLFELYKEQS